jgi:pimeloyl-ACP methyl ester carboxylesterase
MHGTQREPDLRKRTVGVIAVAFAVAATTISSTRSAEAATKKRRITKATTTKTTLAPTTTTTLPPIAPAVFAPCPDSNLECANVSVPLDPKNLASERLAMFVSRRRATGPAPRIGVLFVNPGGPGGPTYDLVRSAQTFLTADVLARFDIIGVDPRGTTRSIPLRCGFNLLLPDLGRDLAAYYDEFGRTCSKTDGDRLQYLDTETAARDLEAIRIALGEEQISYLGMSYGTYLGAVYRTLFPSRVRSMILDSAVDPTRFGVNQLLDPVAAAEAALVAFLADCASAALNPCAFNDGTDLVVKYDTIREKYISTSRRGREAGEELFDTTIADLVGYPRNGWPILGRALQELASGLAPNFNQTAADSRSNDQAERLVPLDQFSAATNFAVNCRDGLLPRDPSSFQTVYSQTPAVGPHFAGLRGDARLAYTCINWPAPVTQQVPLIPQAGAPTLVIGNTYDLTTPYRWSQAMATTLGVTLLTRNGGGHVAITKSVCVRDAAARFYLEGVLPAPGTVCSPSLSSPS